MKRNAFRLALAGATMLAGLGAGAMWSAPASAQAGQAALRGVIRTAPDNPLQDVTLVEVDTGFRRTVVPGADGSYNFPSLRAGAYRLEIRLQKGTRNSDEFTLRVGQNAGLDLDLTTARHPRNPRPATTPQARPRRPRPKRRPATSSSPAAASARCPAGRLGSTSPPG
ncbi:carboxypeptidase-like regulatory domain-containing protein [Sphingomonas sanguinis]|uniref:carboxypeptidase-like regulatory domain-containing protein n=1 Tax=Sphingomonas sp. LC-1 TaxID=3110957 RepID=UPI0021BAE13F|nr:carboxypeptidase-like regulatory domain-containing protein [Sphingomonas sp. LC-1]MCT8000306.1 carboxypeptidase-like regulatory domain-containing protein [Sphingomonas sp. LC-1]